MTGGPVQKNTLDANLRGHLRTNADILTVIDKEVSINDIGALSASRRSRFCSTTSQSILNTGFATCW